MAAARGGPAGSQAVCLWRDADAGLLGQLGGRAGRGAYGRRAWAGRGARLEARTHEAESGFLLRWISSSVRCTLGAEAAVVVASRVRG